MSNWEIIKLGDAATFINGYAFKPKDWKTEGLEIIRIQNLTKSNGSSNYYDGELNPRYKVIKGDFLISWSATLGIFEWRGNDAWLNQHIFKVVFDKKEFDKSFFKHLISMSLDAMSKETHGSTMKHITKPRFDNFQIPYPPLAEQKQIAAILDAADSLRQKDQQLVEHYTALSQSLFLEMFGDPVTNTKKWRELLLQDCLINILGGKSVGGWEREIKPGEKAVLKISAVTSGSFNSNEFKVVEDSDIPAQPIYPRKGDLLFSRANTRDMVGATCIVDKTYDNLFLPDKLWRLDLKSEKASPEYIKFLLSYDGFRENLRKVATGTSGSMLNISKAKLQKLIIPLPPIEIQSQFAERSAIIEQQKQQAQTNLQKSEALFNSLLQRAFTGELTADKAA